MLTVRCDVEGQLVPPLGDERRRVGDCKLGLRLDRDFEQRCGGAIEELCSVGRPTRCLSAVSRQLRWRVRYGKGSYINLVLAGGIGNIGQPVAVGGDRGLALVEVCSQERLRRTLPFESEGPDIQSRLL